MERNYMKQEMEAKKVSATNALLDELNIHLKEVERIKLELTDSLIDKSDSENRDEQRHNISITNKAFENPLMEQLKKEEDKIIEIKTKISKNQ